MDDSDFNTQLSDYLEKSEQCRNFWKSAGLMAVWPAMWPGLRKDHGILYQALCEQYECLCSMRSADDPEIPPVPDREDPFDLSK